MEFPFHPCDPNGPRAEQRKVHAPTSTGGVDSTRRGKAPPLAVFGDFLAAESHPAEQIRAGKLDSRLENGRRLRQAQMFVCQTVVTENKLW